MYPLTIERDNVVTMLRLRRQSLGLTQDQLAGQIGCTRPEIGYWERGAKNPTLGNLIRWARALDCKIEVMAR